MSDKAKILDKIKKCLALSSSCNEHEAAAALRQAQKLMELHGITDLDVQASQAQEEKAKAGAKSKPSSWENELASRISALFKCRVIFHPSWNCGHWAFVGCSASPELAQYTFTVLLRQVKRARDAYIKSNLKRCKTATKTRRADAFCAGWIRSAFMAINDFGQPDEKTSQAIDAYVATNYGELEPLKSKDRNGGRLSDKSLQDFLAGHRSGRDAQLNRGVGSTDQPLAISNI
ncbi:DUF2786 domain-containing protein [Limnohabitans sp.]|uniref:DUF2786 domain-containing protein n=1 Tax=Limnohabitans sp. TaxID=1907725 RepID=UPI00286F5C85|nr:DUF2786 domain-containing protein [Limnohabitans sp.]